MSLSFMRRESRYRKKIKKQFEKADKAGDGKLTKEQWLHVLSKSGCQTTMDEVCTDFDEIDGECEGKLSFSQFMGGEESPLESLFRSMDVSHSGSISKVEFLSVCKNLPQEQVDEAFEKYDIGNERLDFKGFSLMIQGDTK